MVGDLGKPATERCDRIAASICIKGHEPQQGVEMIEWLSNTLDLRFYYWTGLNWIILLPTYLVGAGLIASLWWWLSKRMKRAWVVIAPLFAVLIIAPWVEELWIAWNFGQLCKKDAGIFVYKTVEAEGFYDATMRSAYENTKPGGYRFVEQRTEDRKGVERVERAGDSLRIRALAWYAQTNPGKERSKEKSIVYPLTERETVVVFPNGIDTWKVTQLDHSTARYHYRWPHMNSPAGHGLQRIERHVLDTKTQEVLGRYVDYARESAWFYIGLDRPLRFCKEAERDARARGTVFGPRMVLIPAK
jgi:hypothetical protein